MTLLCCAREGKGGESEDCHRHGDGHCAVIQFSAFVLNVRREIVRHAVSIAGSLV